MDINKEIFSIHVWHTQYYKYVNYPPNESINPLQIQ